MERLEYVRFLHAELDRVQNGLAHECVYRYTTRGTWSLLRPWRRRRRETVSFGHCLACGFSPGAADAIKRMVENFALEETAHLHEVPREVRGKVLRAILEERPR